MPVTLTNSYAIFPILELTKEELEEIRLKCSYEDKSISFQISKVKKYLRSDHPRVLKLKDQLLVKLYHEDQDNILVRQGLACHLLLHVVKRLGLVDKRVLPESGKEYLWKSQPYNLRYYQRECVDALKGKSRGQAVLSTGSGKSLMALYLVKELGLKTLVICPSSLIANQLHALFAKHLGKKFVSMYGDGVKEISKVTIALYQSVARNTEVFKEEGFELVIVDESQTISCTSLIAITEVLAEVPFFYSMSATNFRSDGRTPEIYAASGPVRYTFDTLRAIEEGFLARPSVIMAKVDSEWKEETTSSKKKKGRSPDMKQANYASHVVENDTLHQIVVDDAQKNLDKGMSTLILVQEIEHGNRLADALGLPFANGENSDSMNLIDDLNAGHIQGLIAGAQMCGVGVDTVRVDCLIMCSFPGTEALTLQLLGRGLRKHNGKQRVLVLDYCPMGSDMLKKHGFQRLEWYKRYGTVKVVDKTSRSTQDDGRKPGKFIAEVDS